jgi:hypothetical protein
MKDNKTPKRKDHYIKDGKKVSKKEKHSETYDNETYKHVKEGGLFGGGAGKGDADRTKDRGNFRENYDEIFRRKDK